MRRIVRLGLIIPSLCVLLLLKLTRRILEVRIGVVGFHRFGHLALEPEMYLCQPPQENQKSRVLSVWSIGKKSNQTNTYLAKKWGERLTTAPSWIIDSLLRAGSLVPKVQLPQLSLSIHGPNNGLDRCGPHLEFSSSEHDEGRNQLEILGIDPERPYVCLIIRDPSHYLSRGETESPGFSLLNFDARDFHLTAQTLAAKGFQVVRMGAGSEREFGLQSPGVFDYAKSPLRSEFLDVYIAATCSFAISTQTGPDAVCLAFRRPVCYVDVTRFSQFFFGTRLATWNPTTIRLGETRMSLREIVAHEIFWLEDPDAIVQSGVSIERSSPEQLARMVGGFLEGAHRIDHLSTEVSELDREAHMILKSGMGDRGLSVFGEPRAVLNPVFLQENADWFLS